MQATEQKNERRHWFELENQGQKIFGVLHRPLNVENPPIVILHHGFVSSKVGTNRCWVSLAQALAAKGMATLRFDFRGAGDSEGDLSEMGISDYISDAVAVVEFAGRLEGVDATRMGIFGSSLGGGIAVESAAEHKRAKALCLWAPVASGQIWYQDMIAQKPELAMLDPKTCFSSFRGNKISPRFQQEFASFFASEKIKQVEDVPLLHLHGECDTTISLVHKRAYELACEQRCGNSEFLTYPGVEHFLGYASVRGEVIVKIASWFAKVL